MHGPSMPVRPSSDQSAAAAHGGVWEVARVFLRLGVTAFGGPAAHIAAMEDALVRRRAWVSREEFVDLLSAANVIPGPNSTELAIHLGFRRAGWRGLIVAGLAFVVPASILVWVIAVAYVRYGRRPEVAALLAGMQPVVLAVVVQAVWRLARTVLRTGPLVAIAVGATAAVLAGVNELVVLAMSAIVGLLLPRAGEVRRAIGAVPIVSATLSPLTFSGSATFGAAALAVGATPTAVAVFTAFLKIGSVLFGSGYVLLAFLRAEFVTRHAWLTETQLLDAIAVGQITPGPVFSSATFVGFLLAGHAGAVAASVGIFLPAFVFVAISGPLVRQIRAWPRASAALDGVNAASLALMIGVALLMGRSVGASAFGVVTLVVASGLLLRTRIGAGTMLAGGAALGLLRLWVG